VTGNQAAVLGRHRFEMTMRRLAIQIVGILVVASCGAGAIPGSDSTTTSSTLPGASTTTVTQIEETSTMPADQPSTVEAATADLAQRLEVSPDDITVVKDEKVTWPDGSLGCPDPSMSYTQALVEGSQVVLSHGDRYYDYHAGPDGVPFLCPSSEKDDGYQFVPKPGFND
jgi:hypothetical protein